MKEAICFYHNADLDGLCSAAIVKNYYKRDVHFYGINYGDSFPWDIIKNYGEVIFVDFTLQPFDEMIRISEMVESLIVIDHHKSVAEEYALRQGEIRFLGWIRSGEAACEMCWKFFAEEDNMPMPDAVRLLGRYDVWDLDADPRILPFQYGMRSRINSPQDNLWTDVFASSGDIIKQITQEGTAILRYQKLIDKKYAELFAIETEFGGYNALAINKGITSSQLFKVLLDSCKYNLWITYVRIPNNKWTVSLYSKTIDTSVIAKKHGGGGHAGASGFQCKELPFEI